MSTTYTASDETISTLNNLIETCKDGEDGYRQAITGVDDPNYKTTFETYAQQRAQFASELQSEVRRLGGDPETTGSASASLHRGWINLKSAVTGRDAGAVLSECERGEDSAVNNYQDALNKNLPPDVRATVQRQFTQVKEAHDRIRALRNAHT